MTHTTFNVERYEAFEGYVFDWKEPRYHEEEDEHGQKIQVQDHLYAKVIWLSVNDSIDNYIEVPEPNED